MPAANARAQTPPPLPVTESGTQFLVFFRSQPIGREEVLVLRVADGWVVRGTSRLGPPIDITTRVAEVDYDLQWRPQSLLIDGIVRGQDVTLKTRFDGKQALNVLAVQGAPQSKVDEVSADPVVLPNTFLGSYAALARRLQGKIAGSDLRGYIAPQAEITIHVISAAPERIETPKGVINATRYALTFNNPPPAGDLAVNLWADAEGGLLRMNIPAQMIELAREDIASAASRTAAFSIPGDESVLIPSIGFNLAATITRPKNVTVAPAVILIAGSGPTDRDETVAGIPVFGHLARDLVAGGFAVVRYDKRGVGQSGGRSEFATLGDYAEDVVAAVKFLEKRKDIDPKRIALVGHSEGAAVALLAARRAGNVSAVALIAGIGTTGAQLNLEQQQDAFRAAKTPEAERVAKVELQKKVQAAVLTGKGWEDVPADIRKQAESPWFASFLAFDPAPVIARLDQPLFVIQGALDMQVPPHHAEKLGALANARKKAPKTEVVVLPGINHLLVPARTGDLAEYGTLPDRTISPEVAAKIAAWLKALPAK
jgi:pimeloyl-ACP methyl ester carboxylesterase